MTKSDKVNNKFVATKLFVEGKSILEDVYRNSVTAKEDQTAWSHRLKRLSNKLSSNLENKGIEVAEGNTKVRGNRLIVTDLCFQLSKLEVK